MENKNALTSRTKVLRSVTQLQRTIEDPNSGEDTTAIQVYKYTGTPISWKQRLIGWFRR